MITNIIFTKKKLIFIESNINSPIMAVKFIAQPMVIRYEYSYCMDLPECTIKIDLGLTKKLLKANKT